RRRLEPHAQPAVTRDLGGLAGAAASDGSVHVLEASAGARASELEHHAIEIVVTGRPEPNELGYPALRSRELEDSRRPGHALLTRGDRSHRGRRTRQRRRARARFQARGSRRPRARDSSFGAFESGPFEARRCLRVGFLPTGADDQRRRNPNDPPQLIFTMPPVISVRAMPETAAFWPLIEAPAGASSSMLVFTAADTLFVPLMLTV